MGLAERKAVAAAKEGDYKVFESKIKGFCGFDVALSFDWSLVETHPECIRICEQKQYNGYMFDRITEVITKVCADAMGMEAVKSGLKEIKMIPRAGDLTFKDGVLTIHNDLTGNGAYGAEQIQDVLEKGL